MNTSRVRQPTSPEAEDQRLVLARRLRSRKVELERTTIARAGAVSPVPADPEYVDGLRSSIGVAIEYALSSLERGAAEPVAIPEELRYQARRAARHGVSLDTVLRRYFAGYMLLADVLLQEAEAIEADRATQMKQMRDQALPFDALLAAVTSEYSREDKLRRETSELRKVARLKRLLAGEMLERNDFDYDFEGHHLGLIATGPKPAQFLLDLAATLDRRPLLASPSEDVVWGWIGGSRQLGRESVEAALSIFDHRSWAVSIGCPGQGLSGWRLTHRQAKAALPIALRGSPARVHYSDVALLAAALQDDLLATSLWEIYLQPLEEERDGGCAARQTLRAYFKTERNVTSAAALLGVSRRTVAKRIRAVEERLQCTLQAAGAEIEVALQLDALPERTSAAAAVN